MNAQNSSQPKRTKFLPEDDRRLKEIVARDSYGSEKDIDWNVVAAEMGTKTPRQCRERYKNYLSPTLSNGAWTQKEEELLTQKYEEYGPKWAKMTPFFPGRSDVNIKNHWSSMQNRVKREEKRANKAHAEQDRKDKFFDEDLLNLPEEYFDIFNLDFAFSLFH